MTNDRIRKLEEAKKKLEEELAEAKRTDQAVVSEAKNGKPQPNAQAPSPQSDTLSTGRRPATRRVVADRIPVAASLSTPSGTRKPGESLKDPEPDTDNPGSEEQGGWLTTRQVPAWAISTIVHLIILLILGLITIAGPAASNFAIIVASEDGNEPLEQMAEVDLSEDLETMEEISPAFESPQVNTSDMSDLTLASNVVETGDMAAEILENNSISQINAMFSDDGSAMESLTAKVGKMTASFFGSQSKGRRFVFVVDNSNSMTNGRFHTALNELAKTVEQMSSDQYFYVIFFSDTAYPLFWPAPVSQLVPATRKNKERLHQWLYTVELCLHTRGETAMQQALSLRPDAIYILGDGAFTDKTTQKLTAPHNRPIPIFTLGMDVPQKGRDQLTRIAATNKGTYRPVTVAPGAVQAARQSPVKKNRTRGPVWGVKLPLQNKKK